MFIKCIKLIEMGVRTLAPDTVIALPDDEARSLIARGAALAVERRYNFRLDAVVNDLLSEVTDGSSKESASAE